ncbi:MAG: radical SAM protein [Clostridia bacterium]|nr:radical SAM protein [Clostridia bacterium]
MSFLAKLFNRKKEPVRFLQAIQIEVSSTCNANCTFCPTTYIKAPNEPQFLPLELFETLVPYFSWPRWVYLQGWGEPFLHPDLWKMAELVKQQGAKVGMTTNGTLLNQSNIEALFQSGVDLISISLAGANPATHNRVRKNTDLEQILTGIEMIAGEKEKRKTKQPTIKVSYMLTKDTVSELPETLKRAYELGINEFYCTNLDYVFNQEADNNKLFTYSGTPDPAYEEALGAARRIAHEKNYIFVDYPLVVKEQLAYCEQNPVNFIFITAGGEVTCCPYLSRHENPRYFRDEVTTLPRKSFGNINNNTLEEIWNNQDYIEFRNIFAARIAAYQELMEVWGDSEPSLIVFEESEEKYYAALKAAPLPPECDTCHKIYGF